ncbi:uncharacterized protein LOC101850038 isoform X2 [Aplysia californica]|uniref:Uncharacterized protein LOC101850038 isoform X2 n=1 Tax=Aplysia californica TaxID=6500 RepID=A0ABM0K5X5_APLCA|nr:uncharacterized protein LOC101850038 isoform X2 [Aplysia californica]
MSAATVTISIMPVRHHGSINANWISIMNMPNQGARQVFLYDHGRPHWSQGGPLFYDRRVPPPPPPQMGNFPNPQIQGPSPQWLRGPFIGGPGPGPGPNQQQFDGFGIIPWGNQGNHNYNRHNNRHHHNRNGGAPRNNRLLALNARGNNHRQQHNNNDHEVRYLCFKCGDYLQNSPESGVHLCDAGGPHLEQRQSHQLHNNNGGELQQQQHEDLQARLKAFMEEAKVAVSSDVKLSQEDIHKVCLERAEKFLSLYNQLQNEQLSIQEQQEKLEAQRKELEKRDGELAALQTQLEDDRSKLLKECKKEREEIARKWQELKDEISRMEEMHTMQKGRIRLDVGGSVFTTSRLTLTKDADSMLAAMFSGRHHVTQEEDGTVFIDRDGTHFRYILNYLRDGGVNPDGLPRDRQVLRELRNEAVYFQLNGLVQTIEKFL